jgi:PAS domain S-box-containing protein
MNELPIKRKLMAVIMLTSLTVLILTVAAFMIYDLVSGRENLVHILSTEARMIAENSTTGLAFKNQHDASDVLSSLHSEPQIVAAALYDEDGNIFVTYPSTVPSSAFPSVPQRRGYRFADRELTLYEPVVQNGTHLGTLYLKADLRYFYQRFEIYSAIATLIVITSLAVALVLSGRLQKRISEPILALAGIARRVSEQRDYSVRAPAVPGSSELSILTEGFNQMLARIQQQTVAIQDNETRLRLALGASGIGTWDWDLTTGHVHWDEHNAALFGLTPGEFHNTVDHFFSLIQPEDRQAVEETVRKARENKTEFSVEFRVRRPDGSIHDMIAHGRAIDDASGKAIRMTGVTQDLTERKRSEAASRYLAAIVESSDDAIISKNLDGIITSWNEGAERLFGYSPEIVGQSVERLISPDRPNEEREVLERAKQGETRNYETIRMRRDGTPVHVSLTVSPIRNPQGEIVGVSSIARDITERIRARDALENQARVLREQAQMLDLANVMARDLEDRIILWNTGMEKMYGWLRTETLGHKAHEVLKTRWPKPVAEIREELLRNGSWEGELVHTRKDGRQITVASQWVLHRDNHGRPAAILEVNTDITERKQAEQQMLRMNQELENRVKQRTSDLSAANQELEAFTYSVAHDLRAPLRHIDAFTKILLDDFLEAIPIEARTYLDNIRKGSQNMSRLVDDLLNLARVGRQELKREVTPLTPLIEEVIAELRRETENRQVEWRVAKLPSAETDPGLMKQVFANLLSNAVKYSRPRSKAIIEVGQQQIGDETVIFVRDNGVGFNMKYVDKLFGVFQRLHRADEFEGTGVGLATVERIIRKHGGHIWAEAEIDKGATFFFTIQGLEQPGAVGRPGMAHKT